MLAFGLVAVAAAPGAWAGTTPPLLVAGLAAYLAGLEAIEPLAQEIDHPTVLDLSTADRGKVLSGHLVVPALTMISVAAISALNLATAGIDSTSLAAALAGTEGAAITTVSGAFSPCSESAMVCARRRHSSSASFGAPRCSRSTSPSSGSTGTGVPRSSRCTDRRDGGETTLVATRDPDLVEPAHRCVILQEGVSATRGRWPGATSPHSRCDVLLCGCRRASSVASKARHSGLPSSASISTRRLYMATGSPRAGAPT